jgi:LmbE family N-acetylglucosaminyl deacetylase
MPKILKVLAVFAHPDDESCLAGGTLAQYARAGADITLVTATRGEAGGCSWCEGEALAATRTRELECAARALGIARIIWLECRDGGLADCPDLERANRLSALMCRLHPNFIFTLPPFAEEQHPDHRAIGRWTTLAFENTPRRWASELYYVLNAEQARREPRALPFQIREGAQAKLNALKCHRSQADCWHGIVDALEKGRAIEYLLPYRVRSQNEKRGARKRCGSSRVLGLATTNVNPSPITFSLRMSHVAQ